MSSARQYHSKIVDEIRQRISPQLKSLIRRRMSLAAKIDDALQARGLTNVEFAYMMGKKPSEISRWLSGTHNFTTETLWEIERVLNIQLFVSSPSPVKYEVSNEKEDLKNLIVHEVELAVEKYLSRNDVVIP